MMWVYRLDGAKDGEMWRALVTAVMNFRGSMKCREFLD
jgi:hypothetical protein